MLTFLEVVEPIERIQALVRENREVCARACIEQLLKLDPVMLAGLLLATPLATAPGAGERLKEAAGQLEQWLLEQVS